MTEPQLELREAQTYMGIHEPSIDGIREFADRTFPELFGWLSEHGVAPAGPPFLRYYEVDRAGEPLDVEVGVPVEAPVEGDTRVIRDALPAGSYLTLLHIGPYSSDSMPDLGDARAELIAWASDNGISYGTETDRGFQMPCALEHFRIGPVDDPDFTKWETEFAYLVVYSGSGSAAAPDRGDGRGRLGSRTPPPGSSSCRIPSGTVTAMPKV